MSKNKSVASDKSDVWNACIVACLNPFVHFAETATATATTVRETERECDIMRAPRTLGHVKY